jgi:hypothetical protein
MPMAQKDLPYTFQISVQNKTVGYDRIPTSSIEEIIPLIRLNKCGKSVLSGTDPVAY